MSAIYLEEHIKNNKNGFQNNAVKLAQKIEVGDNKNKDKNTSSSKNPICEKIEKSMKENPLLSKYYELDDWLKTGGSGYVFKAKIQNKQENYAVLKFILFDNKNEKRCKTEIQKEADKKEEYIEDHSEIAIHH